MLENHSTTLPILGLDIGKNIHVLGTYRFEDLQPILEPITLYNNRTGFEDFAAQVNRHLARYPGVILGNEPTGIYYENWGREICQRVATAINTGHLDYRLVNPHMVKLSRIELQRGRPRKTDAIDTQAIARCLQQGQGHPAHFSDGQLLGFEEWGKRFRQTELEKRRLSRILMAQMDRLWPGAFVNLKRFQAAHPKLEPPVPLVQTKPLERQLVQAILDHCPNPHEVLRFSEDEMIAFLRDSIGRGGVKTARKVLRNARQALLPPPEVAHILAQHLSEDWQRYKLIRQRQEILKVEAENLVPSSPAAILTTVPGISSYHAARYYAEVGDVRRFSHPDQIWAFAGFDPVLAQSGDTQRLGKISRRGDAAFRDTLYLIGKHTALHCPCLTATYQRALNRFNDQTKIRATLHTAHKANRMMYHLLREQIPYDPNACS